MPTPLSPYQIEKLSTLIEDKLRDLSYKSATWELHITCAQGILTVGAENLYSFDVSNPELFFSVKDP